MPTITSNSPIGTKSTVNGVTIIVADASSFSSPGRGLGDRTELALKKLGITQDKYKEAKARFGLLPECNCSKKIIWLNKIGEYFGIK